MGKWKTEEIQVKILFAGILLVTLATLLPLFQIAHYNFRSADDYEYAKNAEQAWNETHSVFHVMGAQVSETLDYYHTWQGTYFGVWLTTTVMGIFSSGAYYIGTYLTLGGLVLAELMTFMVILVKALGADYYRAAIVSLSCICMQVLLTPAPSEAYYWLCGAMLYTFIHNLAMVLWAFWILLYHKQSRPGWRNGLLMAGMLFLTMAVAGSNYITALTMLISYVFCALYFWWRKHSYRFLMLGSGILYFVLFLVNVLAPGNAVRQASSGVQPTPALRSILLSLYEAGIYVLTNMILPCVILAVMLIPLFVQIVRPKSYRYPLPFLVTLVSFGVFAAQFTPNLYALGILGAGRVRNLYRFTYYIFIYGNELYWTGWYLRKRREKEQEPARQANGQCSLLPGWIAGGGLLLLSLSVWGGSTVTSYSAFCSLRRGEAEKYYEEQQERLAILEDTSVKEAYLKPFSCAPYVLFFTDIDTDSDNWLNKSMAHYFGKDMVAFETTNADYQ
ncbi:MAG: DUF6056 family protein [Roseburia sp.]|nr:DUF6056 family protein [Roseburia sp.]